MIKTIPINQLNKLKYILAEESFFDYCKLVDDKDFYDEKEAPYLKEICEALQEFENDDNEAIIINEPPRHGKTRTMSDYVEWLLGRNPKYKIMFGSYNVSLSRKSSKLIRNKLTEQKSNNRIVYTDVFPKSVLKEGSKAVDNWRNEGKRRG